MKQAGGNRKRASREHAFQHKNPVKKNAPRPPVAVDKRMDGLELRMGDRRFGDRIDVPSLRERNEVIERLCDPRRRWRNEKGTMGTVRGATNPNLLLPDLAAKRSVRRIDKRLVDRQYLADRCIWHKRERSPHRSDVSLDDTRV